MATENIIIDDLSKFKFVYEDRYSKGKKDFYAVYDTKYYALSDDNIEPIDTLNEISSNISILNSLSRIDTNIYLTRLIFQKYVFIFQYDETSEVAHVNRFKTELLNIYNEIHASLVPSIDEETDENTLKELICDKLDSEYLQNPNNQIELIYNHYTINDIWVVNIQIKNIATSEILYNERYKILNPDKIHNDKKLYEKLKILPLKMTWAQLITIDENLILLNEYMKDYIRQNLNSEYIKTAHFEFPSVNVDINKNIMKLTINSKSYSIFEETTGLKFEEDLE